MKVGPVYFLKKDRKELYTLSVFLLQVALLVQGNWVVKSEILYPPESSSAFSGVPAEVLCRGRDYIMWRFTQNRYLVRKDISSVIKLHAEDVKDILEQMSQVRVHKGWEFLLNYDAEFVNKHSEVVQRQQLIWKAKFDSLSKVLKMIPADMKMAAAACTTSPKRRRTVSRNRTKSCGTDQSDTDERRRHGSGHGGGEPMDTLPANGNLEAEHLTEETIAEMRKELFKFVREKLVTRTVLKLSDFRTGLNFKLNESPAGHALGKGVSDKMLLSVIQEEASGAVQIPENVSKLSEPLFVNNRSEDGLDKIRKVIVDMLKTSNRIIVKAVNKMVNEESDQPVNESDVRRVVREYCTSKGSNWILKGTMH